jgi:hypothetical protein
MYGSEHPDEILSPGSGDPPWTVPGGDETFADPPVEEVVERQLAHYAFVREERDREVRLLFRDVPPSEIARAFRSVGAYLITIMGERARPQEEPRAEPAASESPDEYSDPEATHRKHGSRARHAASEPVGEATLRYFYSVRETVYTVSVVSSSGVVDSLAGLYPSAARLEREVGQRAAIVFRSGVAAP